MTTAPHDTDTHAAMFPAGAWPPHPHTAGDGSGRTLPAGRVTFMFTDIEGSTRLASGLGAEPYRIVLHRHRAVIRDALRRHHGTEIETEGDSFFVAYGDAADAAAAAFDIQTALRQAQWPDLGAGHGRIRPRVRIGLHTGEAWPSAGGYATPEVHRTARICAAAHGDQVLASAQFADAARLGAAAVDRLGYFQLRGLPGHTELVQLNAPGLPTEFPPPPIRPHRHNLPADLKAPIDRTADYRDLDRVFGTNRLVTVTGLDGCGKTALVRAWARRRLTDQPDGVWYCRPGADLGAALLHALGRPVPGFGSALEAAVDHLHDRAALLVLDDVDRDHAWAVDTLLRECPGLTVLAAGPRPLELPGEAKRVLQPPPHDIAAAILAGFCEDRGAAWTPADCRGLAAAVEGFVPALRALADVTAFGSPRAALRRLRDDPVATLDAGGRFRAAIEQALALVSAPAHAVLHELAGRGRGATVDQVLDLCRPRDGGLEALVELVDLSLVVIERPTVEQALYRVPTPLRWLLCGADAEPRKVPPSLASRVVNAVMINTGLMVGTRLTATRARVRPPVDMRG